MELDSMLATVKRTAALAALCGLGITLAGPAAAQTTLTMSSWVPPGHAVTRSLVTWAQDVEKATNGRIKGTMLPKAVSAATGTLDAVREGLVDVSFVSHGYTPGRFVLTKVAEFPFLGDSCEINAVAYNRIYERYLAKAIDSKGLKVLAAFTHGPGEIMNTKRPVTSIADLAGMKIRVGGGMAQDVAKALGVNALLKPAPESYELLSTGVADGTFFPAEAIIPFKLEKVIKYVTHVPGGLYNTSFAALMNEDRFNKFPKQDRDAIVSVSGERLARLIGKTWSAVDKAGTEAMKANNIQLIYASPALVKEIQQKTASIEQEWIKEANSRGVDGAKVLAALREEIKKVAAGQ